MSDFLKERPAADASERERILLSCGAIIVEFATLANSTSSICDDPVPEPDEIWRPREIHAAVRDGYLGLEFCGGSADDLAALASMYLSQPFQSPMFEVLLVDAMVATEICAFAEAMKMRPSYYSDGSWLDKFLMVGVEEEIYSQAKGSSAILADLWFWQGARWYAKGVAIFYGPPAVAALAAWANGRHDTAIVFGGVIVAIFVVRLALSVVRRVRKRIFKRPPSPREKGQALLLKMMHGYAEMRAGVSSSPRRVRELLAAAANEGAVWPPQVFALLDLALERRGGGWAR